MERALMARLVEWKNALRRKPLILNGARQVGKTWLLQEFGKREFENVAYVSLDGDEDARALFRGGFNDMKRITRGLSIISGQEIHPGRTLVVIDEIQEESLAITSLKYFCESLPELHVATAGSLLGLAAHEGTGYPVGKVDSLDLYPMSFREFLDASGNSMLGDMINSGDVGAINAFRDREEALLREYYVVGGMPAVVSEYVDGGSLQRVRALQNQIVEDYARDFTKHVPANTYPRTVEVWQSIPAHLARENKKFVFGHVRKGARAKDFETSLTWLGQAGLVQIVPRVTKPGLPLTAYRDGSAFKVFLLDVGLLGAMSGLDASSVIHGNTVFTEFKGALTEQYVCQQLISQCGLAPFYWSAENSSGEIDFLAQDGGAVYAMEVKAEENLRAKSLRAFKERHPEAKAVRFSLSPYREQEWMRNVPLYAVGTRELWG